MSIESPDDILASLQRAEELFVSELPELLRNHADQWIAYHGDQLIGIASTKAEIYQLCRDSGLSDDEILVRCIEPQIEEINIGPGEIQ